MTTARATSAPAESSTLTGTAIVSASRHSVLSRRAVALTALRGRLVTPVDQSRAGPVLLVPGYGGSAASLQSLADRLRAAVTERPISGLDFLATVCKILGIDYTKQNNTPGGRPIRIVDKGAQPIQELLS